MQLTTHNYSATEDVQLYIEERINKLEKHLHVIGSNVHIRRNTHHTKGDVFEVEVALQVPKKIIVAKTKAPDVRTAFRALEEKIAKQIARYKDAHENNRP